MKHRHIHTNFWDDDYIMGLTDKEQLLFLYFFTNSKVTMSGIYEISEKMLRFRFDLTHEELTNVKKKFEDDRKYFFFKNWIYITNNHKYSNYSVADNVTKSFIKEFNSIPFEVRQHFFKTKGLKYVLPIVSTKKNIKFSIGEIEMEMVMEIEMVMDKNPRPTLDGGYTGKEIADEVFKGLEQEDKFKN